MYVCNLQSLCPCTIQHLGPHSTYVARNVLFRHVFYEKFMESKLWSSSWVKLKVFFNMWWLVCASLSFSDYSRECIYPYIFRSLTVMHCVCMQHVVSPLCLYVTASRNVVSSHMHLKSQNKGFVFQCAMSKVKIKVSFFQCANVSRIMCNVFCVQVPSSTVHYPFLLHLSFIVCLLTSDHL